MKETQSYPLIPHDAFLYQPEHINTLTPSGKQRLIFEGNVPFMDGETLKLKQFEQYLLQNRIVLDEYWTIGRRLRLLQANAFSFQKTITDMNRYLDWVKSSHPLQLTSNVQRLLNQGIVYVSGRDSTYRPIVVFDTKKALETKISVEQYTEFFSYFFQYIVDNLLIQGQIENWVVIVNMAGLGIMSSMDLMKNVGYALSARFHNRMGRCFIVNAPTTFSLAWAVIKKFLYQDTVKKISFTGKSTSKQIFQECNQTQVQKKFGGAQPDITRYWPIKLTCNEISIPNRQIKLLTQQAYFKLYKNNKLTGRKISKTILNKFNKNQDVQQNLSPIKNFQQNQQNQRNIINPLKNSYQPALKKVHSISSKKQDLINDNVEYNKYRPNSIQSFTTIGSSRSLVNLQGCINPIIHFQLNSNKPRTFKI